MLPIHITLTSAVIIFSLTAVGAFASRSLVQEGIRVPCAFVDSVNLTDSKQFPNGSYVYNGLLIPANLTGEYNYILGSSLEHIPVKAHIRGCVCKLKPCVQFCCPPGQRFSGDNICHPANETLPVEGNVTLSSGEVTVENIYEKFAPKFGKACNSMYPLEPWSYPGDGYLLFENGSVFREDDKKFLDRSEYCFGSAVLPDNYTEVLTPYNCFQENIGETKYIVYAWMMLFSVPFILITICVYIGIPELRTLHGKSLCCYLLNLAIGYCILSAFAIVPQNKISSFGCSFGGFTAYFCFMASFFWLSVISFDLFYNIRAPRGRFNEKKRFILYSIYSWGLAFVFLAITMYAQLYLPISDAWKPAIGSEKYCWLDVRKGWSAFVYFYGPIVIIICFNITMFVLTALQINSVQKEMSRMVERHDSQRNLRNEKDRFGIFLRLFIVMGVTWLMEIISYCIGEESAWNKFFYITDILNGIQGFLIFTLFVLKKKVKQYITNRYQSTSRRERQSQYSNKTTSSSINLPLNGMSAEKPLMDKSIKIHA